EHSDPTPQFHPTGLSGGCAKPIFDHAHEKSAKRQGECGLWLRPWSSIDTTKISRPPHVTSGDFPPTRSSRRECEPPPSRRPGVFRGTESSNPLPSTRESATNLAKHGNISRC